MYTSPRIFWKRGYFASLKMVLPPENGFASELESLNLSLEFIF